MDYYAALSFYFVSVHTLQECGIRTTHIQEVLTLQEGEMALSTFLLLQRMSR